MNKLILKCADCQAEIVVYIEKPRQEVEVSLAPKDWIRRGADDRN